MNPTAPILTALETLLEEFDTLFDKINEDIKTATYAGDYDRIKELADNAKAVKDYRSRLSQARKPLVGLELAEGISKLLATPKTAKLLKTSLRKVERGIGTSGTAYHLPVLQVLTEMGGQGTSDEVCQRVEQLLKDELKEHDYQRLPSKGQPVRWRNNVQWARNALKNQGLLKPDSPFGIWEISDEGRAFLEASQKLSDSEMASEDIDSDEVVAE